VIQDNRVLRTMKARNYFGERGLLFSEKLQVSLEALCPTQVWTMSRAVFTDKVMSESMQNALQQRERIKDCSVTLRMLTHMKVIGQGGFGTVRMVKHKYSGLLYALKRVRKTPAGEESGIDHIKDLRTEIEILSSVDHPFMVKLVRVLETASSVYMLTELITGGSLYDQLHRVGGMNRKHAQFYGGSVLLCMEYLHHNLIMYRDLKPENVMLDSQGFLKLIDFGLARRVDDSSLAFSRVGTVFYLAPEVIRGAGYGMEVDIWGLGVLIFELVCGELPFGDSEQNQDDDDVDDSIVLESIVHDDIRFPPQYNDSVGKKLLTGLLTKTPEKRLGGGMKGWEEVRDHRFFKAGVSGNLFSKLMGRELRPPMVPPEERYDPDLDPNEDLSDAGEFAKERD
jgi:cGMP-dependent protein kinase